MSYGNFGARGNGQCCDCGKHEGVGLLHAGDRAARYAHMRDVMPDYLSRNQREYLASWESRHGRVTYEMQRHDAVGGGDVRIARITSWQVPVTITQTPKRSWAEID